VATPTRFSDNVTRFHFERAAVRGALVSLDDARREILDQHAYPPALRRVLAELLAASALLASALSFKGTLIVQLQGKGPVHLLIVECTADLGLRVGLALSWTAAIAASVMLGPTSTVILAPRRCGAHWPRQRCNRCHP
jgi:molecular chaperone Hsp33